MSRQSLRTRLLHQHMARFAEENPLDDFEEEIPEINKEFEEIPEINEGFEEDDDVDEGDARSFSSFASISSMSLTDFEDGSA